MLLKNRNFLPEFSFRTSRSGGAGGQHVNKTETKVELIFDVQATTLLSDAEKEKVFIKLKTYINDEGELRLTNSETRSQSTNKERAILKFYTLLEKALKKEKKRIATKVPKAVKARIRKNKKLHSEKKQGRRMKSKDLM
ncbi:MAG: aminoacyl-tRNA hydrolase [Bacteroidetes bacterium]|nr:aminoacyl-tRNA hydrolase [Bacteroidota bacterium]